MQLLEHLLTLQYNKCVLGKVGFVALPRMLGMMTMFLSQNQSHGIRLVGDTTSVASTSAPSWFLGKLGSSASDTLPAQYLQLQAEKETKHRMYEVPT